MSQKLLDDRIGFSGDEKISDGDFAVGYHQQAQIHGRTTDQLGSDAEFPFIIQTSWINTFGGTDHQRLDRVSKAMLEVYLPTQNGLHFHEARPDPPSTRCVRTQKNGGRYGTLCYRRLCQDTETGI